MSQLSVTSMSQAPIMQLHLSSDPLNLVIAPTFLHPDDVISVIFIFKLLTSSQYATLPSYIIQLLSA